MEPNESKVQYNNESQKTFAVIRKSPRIIRKVMEMGLAKDEKSAQAVILIAVGILFFITWLVWPSGGPKVSQKEQETQKQQMEQQLLGRQSEQ